jgi:hypothetical protein
VGNNQIGAIENIAHLKGLEEFWVRLLCPSQARLLQLTKPFGEPGELQQDPRSKGVGHPASRDHDVEDDISRGQPVSDERPHWLPTEDYPRTPTGHPGRCNVSRGSVVLGWNFVFLNCVTRFVRLP